MTPRPSGSQASLNLPTSHLRWAHPPVLPFHLHGWGNTDEGTLETLQGSPQIKQTWLWKLPGILSGQLLSPRMRDKTKGCIWSSVRATKEAVLTQQGCVCVTCLLEAAFCPVPKMTLSYIKALRRGIRCPSMLKTTFSFLGTRKSLFAKGPSTQISAFWSTAQENYRVQNFSFENGNIPEAFL